MEFYRKLPIPKDVKAEFPIDAATEKVLAARVRELKAVFSGESDKFALIIGPCSADREDSVLEYIYKLRGVEEKVRDKMQPLTPYPKLFFHSASSDFPLYF